MSEGGANGNTELKEARVGLDEDDEMEESKGYDDLLAKFYGVAVNAEEELEGEGDEDGDPEAAAVKANKAAMLTKSEAEAKAKREAERAKVDLNAEGFDPKEYVHHILEKQGIQGLLQEEATIKSQVRNLESDMQMLVYENYNKFISATDMIRKMKTNVESMEQEMKLLSRKMASISNKCEHLEGALEHNRDKMENLVGVNRLLQRLQFLFELPHRLNKSIEVKAYSQAVRYYKISRKILNRYKSIPSFSKISSDSASIIDNLTKILKDLLHSPDQNPLAKMETAGLLLSLQVPPDSLCSLLFASMEDRLRLHLKQVQDAEGKLRAAANAAFQPNVKMVTSTVSSAPSSLPLFSMLDKGFVATFADFAQAYGETFEESKEAMSAFADFTVKIFKRYFDTVARLLDIQALVHKNADARISAKQFTLALSALTKQVGRPANLVPKAKLQDKTATVIEMKIRLFVDQLARHTLSRVTRFLAKAYEVVVDTSREEKLVELPRTLETFLAKEKQKEQDAKDAKLAKTEEEQDVEDAQAEDANAKDAEGEGGEAKEDAKQDAKEQRPSQVNFEDDDFSIVKTLNAEILAIKIKGLVEESVEVLMPVLDVHEYLPHGLFVGLSFANLARGHTSNLLNKILSTLQVGCAISRGGAGREHIFTSPGISELMTSVPGLKDRQIPLFLLYLSEVCRRLHKDHISKAWHQLKAMSNALKTHRQGVNVFQRELPGILANYKAVAQKLLQEYAKVRGRMATSLIVPPHQLKGPRETPIPLDDKERDVKNTIPSPYVAALIKLLEKTQRELDLFYEYNPEKVNRNATQSSQGRSVNNATRMMRMNSEEKYRNRGIERMFRERVDVLESVTSNRNSPFQTILRILAKAYAERLRLEVLSCEECLQVQLDIHCLRHVSPRINDSAAANGVDLLMDEAVTVASNRTRKELEISSILRSQLIEKICESSFELDADNPLDMRN